MSKYEVILEKIDNMHCDIKDIAKQVKLQNGRVKNLEIDTAKSNVILKLGLWIGGLICTTLIAGILRIMFF